MGEWRRPALQRMEALLKHLTSTFEKICIDPTIRTEEHHGTIEKLVTSLISAQTVDQGVVQAYKEFWNFIDAARQSTEVRCFSTRDRWANFKATVSCPTKFL